MDQPPAERPKQSWKRTLIALAIAVPLTAAACLIPTLVLADQSVRAWKAEAESQASAASRAMGQLSTANSDLADCRAAAQGWEAAFRNLAEASIAGFQGDDVTFVAGLTASRIAMENTPTC